MGTRKVLGHAYAPLNVVVVDIAPPLTTILNEGLQTPLGLELVAGLARCPLIKG